MNSDDAARSTARLLLEAAPGGLSIVQDLLNSASMPMAPVPDLLKDEVTAQQWLDASLRTWAEATGNPRPTIEVSVEDLTPLRDLRNHVRGWITKEVGGGVPHAVQAAVSMRNGRVSYDPLGEGAAAVASLVGVEVLLAAHTGALSRLKTCQNPACGAAFYDQSRNGTRVWHDMKTCGNAMNLRASRARRRETPATGQRPPAADMSGR